MFMWTKDNRNMLKQVKGLVLIRKRHAPRRFTEYGLKYFPFLWYWTKKYHGSALPFWLFCVFAFSLGNVSSLCFHLLSIGFVMLQPQDSDQIINISSVYLLLVAALCTHTWWCETFCWPAVSPQLCLSVLFVLKAKVDDNKTLSRA